MDEVSQLGYQSGRSVKVIAIVLPICEQKTNRRSEDQMDRYTVYPAEMQPAEMQFLPNCK